MNDPYATIANLRAMIEERDEEIKQLRELLAPAVVLPRAFGSFDQRRILSILLANSPRIVAYDRIGALMIGRNSGEAICGGTLKVQIYNLRRKLAPFGVTIETDWGVGYSLPTEGAKIVQSAIEERAA